MQTRTRGKDADVQAVTVTVRVHERVLEEFRTMGAELRMALARWREVCLEVFGADPPSPERLALLKRERVRLEYRIAVLEGASTDRSIEVGRDYRGETEGQIWTQCWEAEGLSQDERGLALTIRLNGVPGTAMSRKEIYDAHAKEPLPFQRQRVLLWYNDASRARANLPAAVNLIEDAEGFALVATAYMLDWVMQRGYVRASVGAPRDFDGTP